MISNLQALRGLAALAVAFYHTSYLLPGGAHTEFEAVLIFFVISGFIMSYISRENAGHFFANRLIRIVPLYWLATIFYVVLTHVGLTQIPLVWFPILDDLLAHPFRSIGFLWGTLQSLTSPGALKDLAGSLLFIPYKNAEGYFEPVLGVGWTLNYEMFFYCLFALALIISRRWGPLLVATALIGSDFVHDRLGCGSGCMAASDAWPYPNYFAYFMHGILVYYLWRACDRTARLILANSGSKLKFWICLIVALICVIAVPLFVASNIGLLPISWRAPAGIVLLALLAHSVGLRCTWRPLIILGDASYALYLTHVIVFETLGPFIDHANSSVGMAVTLAAAVLFAVLVHYRIERPIVQGLRRRAFRTLPSTTVGLGADSSVREIAARP